MSFLYRFALTITRKQPYTDWANSLDPDGPELTSELARDRQTIYLVPESEHQPKIEQILEGFWQDIFEEELAMWMDDEDDWPGSRTREMFDAWFDATITESVIDLVPLEPLTQADVDAADLDDVLHHCAWCDSEIDEEAGRFAGLKVADRERFAHLEGRVLHLAVSGEQVVAGIVTPSLSDAAKAGEDLVFRVCTSRCEKAIRKAVPKALRKTMRTIEPKQTHED